jgi:hypothetical protein
MGRVINQHLNCCSKDDNIQPGLNEISLMSDYPFRSPVKHQGNKWNNINDSPSY